MAQIKELERRIVNEAAGHYLSPQDGEGDLYDAQQLLEEASNEGRGDKCASDIVEVWHPLEYKTVDEMLDLIEGGVMVLKSFIEDLKTLGY